MRILHEQGLRALLYLLTNVLQIRQVVENSRVISGSCLLFFQETFKPIPAFQVKLYFDAYQVDKKQFNYIPVVREDIANNFYNTFKLEWEYFGRCWSFVIELQIKIIFTLLHLNCRAKTLRLNYGVHAVFFCFQIQHNWAYYELWLLLYISTVAYWCPKNSCLFAIDGILWCKKIKHDLMKIYDNFLYNNNKNN